MGLDDSICGDGGGIVEWVLRSIRPGLKAEMKMLAGEPLLAPRVLAARWGRKGFCGQGGESCALFEEWV